MADFRFFHDFIFRNESAKSSYTAMGSWVFFKGLNFTNDQHPRNLRNLRTSKKTNYTVYGIDIRCFMVFVVIIIIT